MGCSYNNCGLPIKTKKSGYCNAHYLRMLRGKDMDTPVRPPSRTDAERFWEKVKKTAECWIWTGANIGNGYGVFRINGGNRVAHRVSFEWANGPIPAGLEVDHTCFNRLCVKPSHLRLLTHAQNGQNRASANINSKSGIRGVYKPTGLDTWIASARKGGETFEIGRFDNMFDAEKAAIKWRREHMPVSINDMRKES